MVKYKFSCDYCGHTWVKLFYYLPEENDWKRCEQCKDTNIKKIKVDKLDFYGYNINKFFKKKDKKDDDK